MKRDPDKPKKISNEQIWTLSNIISILRAALAFPIIIFIDRNQMVPATVCVLLAIISDMIDGFIARKFSTVTLLGKILDPIADKICILSILLYLIISQDISVHFLIGIALRDISLAIMHVYLVNHKLDTLETNYAGKTSTVLISLTLIVYVYNISALQVYFLFSAYCVMAISLVQYALTFTRTVMGNKSSA
jgi:CDP-diacylglycerol--glycerol-3-phosphate 3-phosphatidyltransferase